MARGLNTTVTFDISSYIVVILIFFIAVDKCIYVFTFEFVYKLSSNINKTCARFQGKIPSNPQNISTYYKSLTYLKQNVLRHISIQTFLFF